MRQRSQAFVVALAMAASLSLAASPPPAADEQLSSLLSEEWSYTMHTYPEYATWIGYPGQNNRFSDRSWAAIEAGYKHTKDYLQALHQVHRSALSAAAQVNYDLATRAAEERLEGQRFHSELLPMTQLGGLQQELPQLLQRQPAETASDYRDLLARLSAVPLLVDQTIALLQQGLKEGITPPQVTLRDVPDQIRAQIFEDPLQSPILAAFKTMPASLDAGIQTSLRREASEAYKTAVAPALQKLYIFFNDTYLPKTTTTIGLAAQPNGKDWYAYNARVSTTTKLTPEEIHAIGLKEVARIRGEMDKLIKKLGFEGTFAAFGEFMRTDPRFFYEDKNSLLAGYRDIAKRIDPELPRLFGKLPRLTYGVQAVPAYSEKSQAAAYYEAGSPQAFRSGTFFANTYDLNSRPRWEMEALTLHEAVPGHHLQIALAQEQATLPEFRKNAGYTAFIEGWGLYSESLGSELGLYNDPYSQYGQLTFEIWRAIRLVVDTGIHSLGWGRQQAIDYFKDNSSRAEHDIGVEVDRYIVMPGQALAYKIGELKLKELRAYATAELGSRFDVRAFHDEILGSGAVPLDVLETHMREWVAKHKRLASNP